MYAEGVGGGVENESEKFKICSKELGVKINLSTGLRV